MYSESQRYDYSELLGIIKSKNLRQEDLARRINMNPSTLNLKLNNKSEFTQSQMKRICKVLDIPLNNLSKVFFCLETLENAS